LAPELVLLVTYKIAVSVDHGGQYFGRVRDAVEFVADGSSIY
jgi:hypothetical protein